LAGAAAGVGRSSGGPARSHSDGRRTQYSTAESVKNNPSRRQGLCRFAVLSLRWGDCGPPPGPLQKLRRIEFDKNCTRLMGDTETRISKQQKKPLSKPLRVGFQLAGLPPPIGLTGIQFPSNKLEEGRTEANFMGEW